MALISRRFSSSGRSVMSSMLLRPSRRRSAPQTAPPQPASNARRTLYSLSVGGPEASQKGLGDLIPRKSVCERSHVAGSLPSVRQRGVDVLDRVACLRRLDSSVSTTAWGQAALVPAWDAALDTLRETVTSLCSECRGLPGVPSGDEAPFMPATDED